MLNVIPEHFQKFSNKMHHDVIFWMHAAGLTMNILAYRLRGRGGGG